MNTSYPIGVGHICEHFFCIGVELFLNTSYPTLGVGLFYELFISYSAGVGIFVDTSYAIGVGLFYEHFLIFYPTLGVGLFVNNSYTLGVGHLYEHFLSYWSRTFL